MQAQLSVSLDGAGTSARSVVLAAEAHSPLSLRTPRNHGHAAWVYQSSLGGGFVGSDDVRLSVEVAPGASLFLSSQASSKVYRATDARYTLNATVAAGATLVSWPDPVVCFAGAGLNQRQSFALDGRARLVCVDAWTSGRLAHGERWAFERLESRIDVDVDGMRVFRDAVSLTSQAGALAARMGPIEAMATVLVVGLPSLVETLAIQIQAQPLADPSLSPLVTISCWRWGAVIRVGAPSAERLGSTLRDLLAAPVAALLGDDPWARKW